MIITGKRDEAAGFIKLGGVPRKLLTRPDTSVIAATVILFLLFTLGTESFLTPYNLFNIARASALNLFVAMGQVFVLIVGGMNLSLGDIGGLSAIASGYCMEIMGFDGWTSALLALVVGIVCGLVNGLLITNLKLNSFVVTLATSFVFRGIINGITKGYPYKDIDKSFTIIGREGLFGIPYLFYFMIVILVIIWLVFRYTTVGRMLLATGGNEVAARLSGIKTRRMILLANVMSGLFAALAGILWVSRLGSAPPGTGSDWMIISFAVAVIGGTALSGGEIIPVGLFASSIMITLIKNGLIMFGVNVYFEQTFLGLIILLSVALESLRLRYSSLRRL